MNTENKDKKINMIIGWSLTAIIVIPLLIFVVKPTLVMYSTSRGAELGLSKQSYTQSARHCPTNVELAQECDSTFLTNIPSQETKDTAVRTLKAKGYAIKQLNNGYDGPDEVSLVAFNPKNNTSLVVVISVTDGGKQGRVRLMSFGGQGEYQKQDLHITQL